ncbi:hypothetical protein Sango_2737900 [Sesamum angolense]|uniref:Uncharacterized protein n=1 Tax=Sesamum angolense TaxID=2727404 RepID=A0AAE1W0C7_9LAMI|nr:hypothetical protein Sango_2737900 [Sesamum angolense]
MRLFEKEDSSNADDCISTITFTDEDVLLGSKPHNRPLFVAGYINLKQPPKLPLKGFVPSTQEEEGRHEALAINEKRFDPKVFKLLIKAGYNPKEKLSLGKLPPKVIGKKPHGLNAIQIMLKEKGYAIQDSRVEEDVAQTYHITLIEDGEVEEEDAENAPIELEEGVKATINLGNTKDPRPIYTSASLAQDEKETP